MIARPSSSAASARTKQTGTRRGSPSGRIVARTARLDPADERLLSTGQDRVLHGPRLHSGGDRTARSDAPRPTPDEHQDRRRPRAPSSRFATMSSSARSRSRSGPRARGRSPVKIAVTMRTPGFEAELAIGFMTSEGLLEGNEILGVDVGDPGFMAEPDDAVLVRTARRIDPSIAERRHFIATASCGICGKASIDEIAVRAEPLPEGPARRRAFGDPLAAGSAAGRPGRVRADRRPPRGRVVRDRRPAGGHSRRRRPAQRPRQGHRLAGRALASCRSGIGS